MGGQGKCVTSGSIYYSSGGYNGGGGGYYGGATGHGTGGGGGSSYINGHAGCSDHASGKKFTNTVMIAGNTSMPSTSGGTETGRSGNGYAKITYLGQ